MFGMMNAMTENRYLFSTVFLTGACVLILEIAAVRILSPYYGSSLYVFSSVLTVILAALSIGYWYGGKRADREHSIDVLYKIITISGVLVLALLFAAMLVLPTLGAQFSVVLGPLLFSLTLFFAPAFLLGIVSPYIIKLQSLATPQDEIGSVVGKTFFWGTVGSITGSLATGFWLIPTLGVQHTIILVSVILIAIGLVVPLLMGRALRKHFFLVVIGIVLGLSYLIVELEREVGKAFVYRSDGLYSSIAVRDFTIHDRPARMLLRDTNNSSAIYLDSDEFVFHYTQFTALYPTLKPDTKEYLVLGGGAYSVPRTLLNRDPELNVDVVEIEPVLYEIAQEYFDLGDTSRLTNYPMDARVFLANTDKKYDVIFGDTFGTDHAAPFHLTTHEFYELVYEHLEDDGIFIMNYIGRPKGVRPSLTGSVVKTLMATFPNMKAFGTQAEKSTEIQNIIFIARKGDTPIDVGDALMTRKDTTQVAMRELELPLKEYRLDLEYLLTDNHAPVEYLMARQQ